MASNYVTPSSTYSPEDLEAEKQKQKDKYGRFLNATGFGKSNPGYVPSSSDQQSQTVADYAPTVGRVAGGVLGGVAGAIVGGLAGGPAGALAGAGTGVGVGSTLGGVGGDLVSQMASEQPDKHRQEWEQAQIEDQAKKQAVMNFFGQFM